MNPRNRLTLFWIVVILCYGTGAGAEHRAGACVTCHQFLGGELARPVAEWNGSIHQQNGITCDLCHGGNAGVELGDMNRLSGEEFSRKQSGAMSTAHGFIGKPAGKALFDMCATCHSASVAQYANSIMGEAYLNKKGGPSCVACHQAHNNVIPDVPKSCAGCHKDTTGFSRIDAMNVTAATVNELSRIRIRLAGEKSKGARPPLVPALPEELDSFVVGLLSFGAVLVLYIFGYLVYMILEKER